MKKISLNRVFTVLGYFKMFIDLFRTIKAKEKSNIVASTTFADSIPEFWDTKILIDKVPQKKKLEEDEPCL